jgi:hypothetical protein
VDLILIVALVVVVTVAVVLTVGFWIDGAADRHEGV